METFQSKVRKIRRLLNNNRIKKINPELNLRKTDMQQVKVKLGFVLGTHTQYPFVIDRLAPPKTLNLHAASGSFIFELP